MVIEKANNDNRGRFVDFEGTQDSSLPPISMAIRLFRMGNLAGWPMRTLPEYTVIKLLGLLDSRGFHS